MNKFDWLAYALLAAALYISFSDIGYSTFDKWWFEVLKVLLFSLGGYFLWYKGTFCKKMW